MQAKPGRWQSLSKLRGQIALPVDLHNIQAPTVSLRLKQCLHGSRPCWVVAIKRFIVCPCKLDQGPLFFCAAHKLPQKPGNQAGRFVQIRQPPAQSGRFWRPWRPSWGPFWPIPGPFPPAGQLWQPQQPGRAQAGQFPALPGLPGLPGRGSCP